MQKYVHIVYIYCNECSYLCTAQLSLFLPHALIERGFPIVLIPWVVLQELDALKKGKGLSVGSVAHLAVPAISYILDSLKSKEPRLWGQSMQQAAQSSSEWWF